MWGGAEGDIRYYSSFNFVGERIDGYEEPAALLLWESEEGKRILQDSFASRYNKQVHAGRSVRRLSGVRMQEAPDSLRRHGSDSGAIHTAGWIDRK